MTSPRPAVQNSPANRRDLMWSRSEKAIAQKAFDAALERELQEVIQEAKQKAGQIKEPADLWELEHYLTERGKEIDRKYDYRYSQLTQVFGRLLHEGRLCAAYANDKLKSIRSFAELFAKYAA
jgi:hypothetical protein